MYCLPLLEHALKSKREHVAASNPHPASLTGNAHAASVPPFHVVLHVSIQVPADWSLCCVAWRRPLSSLQGLRIPERGMLFLSYDCQAFHCFPPSSKDGHLGLLAGTCTESLQPASSLQLSRKRLQWVWEARTLCVHWWSCPWCSTQC